MKYRRWLDPSVSMVLAVILWAVAILLFVNLL
jgi:hypothetical protein